MSTTQGAPLTSLLPLDSLSESQSEDRAAEAQSCSQTTNGKTAPKEYENLG